MNKPIPTLNPAEMRVAILEGGTSVEREVSLNTGKNVATALGELGFTVDVYDAADLTFIEKLRITRPDFVFIALHGKCGEDGTIQGLLEVLGLPYTGSGVLSSALAMNKDASKDIFIQAGLNTPKGILADRDEIGAISDSSACTHTFFSLLDHFDCAALVVKPNGEGSSVGVSIVESADDFFAAVEEASDSEHQVLIEEFIKGRELTVCVLGDANIDAEALPIIEIIPKTEFYHYKNKYSPGATDYVCPADLSPAVTQAVQDLALSAHNALGCQGYSRSDILLTAENKPYLLETNTLPGLTATSLIPMAAAAAGMDLSALLIRISQYAFTK